MEEKKTLVIIDMDGSLVNLDKVLIDKVSKALKFDLRKAAGKTYSYEETISRYVDITKEEARNILCSIWNKKDFWRSLPAYEGAVETINELSEYCKILICTRIPKASPTAFIEKESWINDHFPNVQTEFFAVSDAARKTRIRCDYIVEDSLKEIRFCPTETTAILINRSWNTEESVEWTEDLKFIRVDGWRDIREIILKK
jgi:5'(3')-deoxyribonucleotidase